MEKIGDEDDEITDLGHKKELSSPSLSKPGIESDYELVYRNAEYQIRPSLVDKFKSLSVKEIIHGIIYEELGGKTYHPEESVKWIKNIVMSVKEGVKELGFKRYKLIVQTILGQNKGSGVKRSYLESEPLMKPQRDGRESKKGEKG